MKVNIISSKAHNNSVVDTNILCFLFKKIKHKIEPKAVPTENYTCDVASINIFIGVINPLLVSKAKTNILLFDCGVFPKSQAYTLKYMDYVFVKTEHEYNLVGNTLSKNKIINMGWRSSDLNRSTQTIDYSKYLLFCYDKNTDYKAIIDVWHNLEKENPEFSSKSSLHIVNFNLTGLKEPDITAKNIVIEKSLTQESFEHLFNECGIHLCTPSFDTFSHYLNQTMLSRCIPIISNIPTANELTTSDYSFIVDGKESKNKTLLGGRLQIYKSSIEKALVDVSKLSVESLKNLGVAARMDALKYHSRNDVLFKEHFIKIINATIVKPTDNSRPTKRTSSPLKPTKPPKVVVSKDEIKDLVVSDDALPTVSILTLTHNRKKFFNLAIYNFNNIDYPRNKLEWVIYDTSNEANNVEKLLPPEDSRGKYNIRYFKENKIETIGNSRNFAISQCKNDIIVMMDDDDYYPDTSVRQRVAPFVDDTVKIACCSIIGTFEINKYISYVDYPDIFGHPNRRFKIASMAIRRELINNDNNKCDDKSISEFNTIISTYLNSIHEINWEGAIISLTHSQNTTFRNVPNTDKNGCHFGFGEKMFKFITELDKTDDELRAVEDRKKKALEEHIAKQQEEIVSVKETQDKDSSNK